MSLVYYTGVGSKENGFHTPEEFLSITKYASLHYFEMCHLGFDMEYKNFLLPEHFSKFTLEDWVEYVGADLI